MTNGRSTIVEARMLIRRPVSEVFRAFVDPNITTKFWFTKSSGPLEPGKNVRWDWEMFGVSDTLMVKRLEDNQRILVEWDSDATTVEWRFEPRGNNSTFVKISHWGLQGSDREILAQAVDSKGGFTLVLAGLKTWLEFGIAPNFIRDQFPDGCPHSTVLIP